MKQTVVARDSDRVRAHQGLGNRQTRRAAVLFCFVSGLLLAVSASPSTAFQAPAKLPSPPNDLEHSFNIGTDAEASISADGLTMYWHQFDRRGGSNYFDQDIVYTTRASVNDPWGGTLYNEVPGVNATSQSSARDEYAPSISHDGLELYFATGYAEPASEGNRLWVATRSSTSEPFGAPVPLSFDGSYDDAAFQEYTPEISRDGQHLYFASTKQTANGMYGKNLFVAERISAAQWGNIRDLGNGVSYWAGYDGAFGGDELSPTVSDDELAILFAASRLDGGYVGIFMAMRNSTSEEFGDRVPVTELNTDGINNSGPEIGYGWTKLDILDELPGIYLNKDDLGPNREDLYYARAGAAPSVLGDLDGNCQVDEADFGIFASHWLASDCVAPEWCGGADLFDDDPNDPNGTVDWADLGVFASYWLDCCNPPCN